MLTTGVDPPPPVKPRVATRISSPAVAVRSRVAWMELKATLPGLLHGAPTVRFELSTHQIWGTLGRRENIASGGAKLCVPSGPRSPTSRAPVKLFWASALGAY